MWGQLISQSVSIPLGMFYNTRSYSFSSNQKVRPAMRANFEEEFGFWVYWYTTMGLHKKKCGGSQHSTGPYVMETDGAKTCLSYDCIFSLDVFLCALSQLKN